MEPQSSFSKTLKFLLLILSLNLGMFLVGLDNTIISSAIPKITDQFHALSHVGWYASAYLLTNCAFQLIWGKLFTFYIVKWVYLCALLLFEIGSLICAVAPSSTVLIVGRAIAGIGGGGVTNGSFLLIAHSVPQRQRPAYIGMMGAMIVALLVLAGVLFGAFAVVQYVSGELATIPGRVFGNRNVWGSALFGSCVTAAFFIMMYYMPIWLQAIKGATPIRSGVMSLPMVIGYVVFSFLGGSLTSVIGYYVPFAYFTVIFMAIGSGLLSTLRVDSGSPEWIGYQVMFGAGVGFGLQTSFAVPQCVLALEDIPIGTAIVIFTENLSAAVMVSVAQNVFTNQLKTNILTDVPGVDVAAILDGGATSVKSLVPENLYAPVLVAYNRALGETFYVGLGLSCLATLGALALQWVSVRKK
ncbi:hypothetical protein FE257_000025 [Aspergillus nanangensis]|uniref:Major facilitator superfamily (MFS) profile domain-containing protein n=1 Tax=Aspergillus nanangensis TaxID=2582783 RepID=A0AAD4H0V9_ASPNN|nr:hypothetical protein FE257_000025 [Aspergillus nanangensis]